MLFIISWKHETQYFFCIAWKFLSILMASAVWITNKDCNLRFPWWGENAQCENCELSFIWGKMRTIIPGDSTSNSSEKLLQRGRGKVSIFMILVKQGCMQSSTYFSRRFLLVTRSSCHHEGFWCFSRYEAEKAMTPHSSTLAWKIP